METAEKYRSALYAGIVGDALGVPVEFSPREELALRSVKNMFGYGRYDQPAGTWSDDTSLTLCTMESLCRGYDLEDMGQRFCRWLFESYWTATGYVFDAGLTTFVALDTIHTDKKSAGESGCADEDNNGNGSLMRILPAALYFARRPLAEMLKAIHEVSAVTHAHPRAKMGCGIYATVVAELLRNPDPAEAYRIAAASARRYYQGSKEFRGQLRHFSRILGLELLPIPAKEIGSSGYVVDTLEAAIWCFLRNDTTKDVLLAAINLGLDTDTTGMVAGGLAGIHYGIESIPDEWLDTLARKDELDTLISSFVEAATTNGTTTAAAGA